MGPAHDWGPGPIWGGASQGEGLQEIGLLVQHPTGIGGQSGLGCPGERAAGHFGWSGQIMGGAGQEEGQRVVGPLTSP